MASFYRPLYLLFALLIQAQIGAQAISFFDQNPTNLCSGSFVDTGGENGNHAAAGTAARQLTICSDGSQGPGLLLSFRNIDIDGELTIFDGPDDSSNEAIVINGSFNGQTVDVPTTAGNTSGCLTVVFESTGSGAGWIADISCTSVCQLVEAELTSVTPAPDPDGAVSVCTGEPIRLEGRGRYPEDNVIYDQDDALSTFRWDFQDGTIIEGNGSSFNSVLHAFEEPGGYTVELTVTDQNGCRNTAFVNQRVKVSGPPRFGVPGGFPDAVCPGEEIALSLDAGGSGVTINPEPNVYEFRVSDGVTQTISLPDVGNVPFPSPLVLRSFDPGQTLQRTDQIVEICATLEHSWFYDLDIFLVCPAGDTIFFAETLASDPNSAVFLGGGTRGTPAPEPGERYCWTPGAAETIDDFVVRNNFVDRVLPPGNYAPERNGFDNLVGCPLNGIWTFVVFDRNPEDEGTFYDWNITFTDETYPAPETFTQQLSALTWRNTSNLTTYDASGTVTAIPPNPGTQTFILTAEDNLGCTFDTSYLVDVRSPFDPACGNCLNPLARSGLDTALCNSTGFQANLVREIDTTLTWRYDADETIPGNAATSQFALDVNEADLGDLVRVCLNLENGVADLGEIDVDLTGPQGDRVTLVTGVGTVGDDLVQTCFTLDAAQTLAGNGPSFTGDFQYAGLNSPGNGRYLLEVTSRNSDLSRLLSWTLEFDYTPTLTYAWTPVDGNLSCTDCPNPTISPTASETYVLTVGGPNSCSQTAAVVIDFTQLDLTLDPIVSPPSCGGDTDGSIQLQLSGSDGPFTVRWNTGATTPDIGSLGAGDYVATITGANGCSVEEIFNLPDLTALEVSVADTMAVSCFGGADGEIALTTSGGRGPYTYEWTAVLTDPTVTFNDPQTESIGALTAGTYSVTVRDSNGCAQPLTQVIGQPAMISLQLTADSTSCVSGTDGSATVVASGGNGNYSYRWSSGDTTATAANLGAGSYSVTVTDGNNCPPQTGTIPVAEPATALFATAAQDELGCSGIADNVATVSPSGGRSGYTFLWTSGETTATATQLSAGTATVTVTDGGGCTTTDTVNVGELDPITVVILKNSPSCNDTSDGTLAATPSGGVGIDDQDYGYVWSTGETGSSIDNIAGNASYGVTVTDPRGCVGEGERFLDAPPAITFLAEETPVSCNGFSDGELRLSDVRGPTNGTYIFNWGPEAGGATTSTVSNLPAGTYNLNIEDPDRLCDLDTMLVITEPDSIRITTEQKDVGCFGDQDGRLTAVASGGTGVLNYRWSDSSRTNLIDLLPAGTYGLTVTDDNGCRQEASYLLAEPIPLDLNTSPEAALCFGEPTGRIQLEGVGGRPPFVFSLDNDSYSRNPTFIGLDAGDYLVFVRDNAGCKTNALVSVPEGPVFTLDAGPDTSIVFGDPLVLTPTVIGGADTINYRWTGSYDGTLSCTDCPNPEVSPEFEIDYRLLLTDANGCQAEDRLRVSVRKIREVAVPTGFSPNDDGRNDRLLVHGRPGTRVLTFQVFDRYGGLLFTDTDFLVNDANRGWDGNSREEPMNAGVYIYTLEVEYEDGSQELLKGETTLIK